MDFQNPHYVVWPGMQSVCLVKQTYVTGCLENLEPGNLHSNSMEYCSSTAW